MTSDPTDSDDPNDVAEEEAEAIADEISAEPVTDRRLTAPTSDDPS